MDIPNYRTWVENEVVTPQDLNTQVRDAGHFQLGPPLAIVDRRTDWTPPMTAVTTVPFDTVVYDNDNIWNAGTNQMIIQTPGFYRITVNMFFNCSVGTAKGTSRLQLANSVYPEFNYRDEIWAPEEGNKRFSHSPSFVFPFNPGESVSVKHWQNINAGLFLYGSGGPSQFACEWIRAL